jgi:hypothetical protein
VLPAKPKNERSLISPGNTNNGIGMHALNTVLRRVSWTGDGCYYNHEVAGHNDIKTTLCYLHVTNQDMLRIISLLDDLGL